MLPYVAGRPISMKRYPQGIEEKGFFQKEAGEYFPDWITRVAIKHSTGVVHYVVINNAAILVYLANQACITPHVWLSRVDKPDNPDRIIFDLDPADEHSFTDVQRAAKMVKKILDELELPSFCMLTGSRGAHIVIPIKRLYTFEETREFAHSMAQCVATQDPEHMTIEVHKEKRGKRVFIDWLRNGFGATGVAPYAVRAHEGAPVAMPVTWDELLKKGMTSQKYTIKNARKRIESIGDVWSGMHNQAVSLAKALKLLDNMNIRL